MTTPKSRYQMNPEFLPACTELGLSLTQAQVELFDAFEEALYAANSVMNLTRVPQEECWLRHFIDSLLFQDLIPEGSTVLDIGTGPGFPAWPLACARLDLNLTALDSSGKMLGFLRNQVLPNLDTVQVRAEEWGVRDVFDVVTGRALAPLAIQLELSAPLAKEGGIVIPMRTPSEEPEIRAIGTEKLGLQLENVIHRSLPGTEITRTFAVYRKIAPTQAKFPRPWAEMKRKPLT